MTFKIKVKKYFLSENQYRELLVRSWNRGAKIGDVVSDEEIEAVMRGTK